jgi:hypothetical protein
MKFPCGGGEGALALMAVTLTGHLGGILSGVEAP